MNRKLFEFLELLQKVEKLGHYQVDKDIDEQRNLDTERLAMAGWTVVPWLTYEQMHSVSKIENTLDDINAILVDLYDYDDFKNLRGLVDNTILQIDHFSNWEKTLSECVDCYIAGKYLVVIPALLSIVEGSLSLALGTYESSDIHLKKHTKVKSGSVVKRLPTSQNWNSINQAVHTLFDKSDFSGPQPKTLNRHWVLHGRSMPQGNERIDVLKLFNLLGTIAMECISLDEIVQVYND